MVYYEIDDVRYSYAELITHLEAVLTADKYVEALVTVYTDEDRCIETVEFYFCRKTLEGLRSSLIMPVAPYIQYLLGTTECDVLYDLVKMPRLYEEKRDTLIYYADFGDEVNLLIADNMETLWQKIKDLYER